MGFWCLVRSLLPVESCQLRDFVSMYRRGVCSPGTTVEVFRKEERHDMCSDVCPPGATGVLLCTMETVTLPNIQSERTLSLGKLPWEGGVCVADSKNITYTASLVSYFFWWCNRVSLLIKQEKLQRAWSAFGWVPVTRYKYNEYKQPTTNIVKYMYLHTVWVFSQFIIG
jgi:hypothetical protein